MHKNSHLPYINPRSKRGQKSLVLCCGASLNDGLLPSVISSPAGLDLICHLEDKDTCTLYARLQSSLVLLYCCSIQAAIKACAALLPHIGYGAPYNRGALGIFSRLVPFALFPWLTRCGPVGLCKRDYGCSKQPNKEQHC